MSWARREAEGNSRRTGAGDDEYAEYAVSEPMRRVVESLLDGATPSPTDREALTDEERAELASLIRTANLTRLAIQAESPNPAAEQASLDRAQSDLQRRVATGTLPAAPLSVPTGGGLRAWLDRLVGRQETGSHE